MAVLDSFPGLVVSVLVDGNTLQEYPDDEEAVRLASLADTKTIPVFVEAVSEKEFVVRLSVEDSFHPTSPTVTFAIIVDGQVAYRRILWPISTPGSKDDTLSMTQARNIEGAPFSLPGDPLRESLKKFKFSKLGTFIGLRLEQVVNYLSHHR